jgi:hypothetical protein
MSETSDDMAAFAMLAEENYMIKSRKEYLAEVFCRISDESLLDIAVAVGEDANRITDHFKCYDVALKIKSHGWKPTAKQRSAITNVLAYYLADLY